MAKLRTWVIRYADGMTQEVDAFNRASAKKQATHGAPISLIVPVVGKPATPRMPKLERLGRVQTAREATIDRDHVCAPGHNPRFCKTCCRAMDPAAEGMRAARRQNALGDPIGRISITLKVDDEEPMEAEFDLLPDEDPVLVAQRLVTSLFRLRTADAKRRS